MTNLCQEWLPDVKEYIRDDGKLVVKLDKEWKVCISITVCGWHPNNVRALIR